MKLYSIKQQILFDYSTANFIPVTTDGINLDNCERTFGEVLTVRINNRGNGLTTIVGTSGKQISNYYCKIVGDGSSAVANVDIWNTCLWVTGSGCESCQSWYWLHLC